MGATATLAAAARALAARGPNPLVDDSFAEPLVRAVGMDFFNRILDGNIGSSDLEDDATFNLRRLVLELGIRTGFFDDFVVAATRAGVRQVVILASGLDARAYRLSWPKGAVVYEIDQPPVIEFKTRTLAALNAHPGVERRVVGVDLRDDWPHALQMSGFTTERPTAWLAEGLMMYLPPDAQDRLLSDITRLSAGNSRLGTEHYPDVGAVLKGGAKALTSRWRAHGFQEDLAELFSDGERGSVVDQLTALGWSLRISPTAELARNSGMQLPGAGSPADDVAYLDAILG